MAQGRTTAGCAALTLGAVGFVISHRLAWTSPDTDEINRALIFASLALTASVLVSILGTALLTKSRGARVTATVFYILMATPVLIGAFLVIIDFDPDTEGAILGIYGIMLGFITIHLAALVAIITAIRFAVRAVKQRNQGN